MKMRMNDGVDWLTEGLQLSNEWLLNCASKLRGLNVTKFSKNTVIFHLFQKSFTQTSNTSQHKEQRGHKTAHKLNGILPNKWTAVHVLSEKDDAEERYEHECGNTLLNIPLHSLHHVTTDSCHKAIFTVDSVIVYYKSICTAAAVAHW
jgi:hypothetical protein